SFVSDILFTTVLLRIGELSLLNPPVSVTIGETANYPIFVETNGEQPIFVKGNELEFIPNKRVVGNVTYIDLSGEASVSNLKSGIYELENNSKKIGKLAINYSRKESKISTWTNEEIENGLKQSGILHTKLLTVDKGASAVDLNVDKPY